MTNLFEWSGIVGGVIIAGSYLPQIYKLLKTKTARGISTIFVTALLVGSLLLLIYSLYVGDTLFIALNGCASVFAGTVLALAVYYKYHENEGSGKVLRQFFPKKGERTNAKRSRVKPKKAKSTKTTRKSTKRKTKRKVQHK